jgi:hypothetical protein
MDVEDLALQEIAVDDDNKPAPENSIPTAGAAPPKGNLERPSICPCCASSITADNPGKWKKHHWDLVADYDELILFRMCFPEVFIVEVLIPSTNKELADKLYLQEFYIFLGLIFYMACFNGIEDRELWWSTKPVDMLSGAPFCSNGFVIYKSFRKIMSAL